MALQQSGVQLVIANQQGFLGGMGQAQKAVQGFESSIGKAAPALGAMSIGSLALGTALGGALLSGITAAAQGFFQLSKSAFVVTAEYERLSVSLQTLLAREIKTAGLTQDMGQAFDMAAPAARELLDWIEELAIKSPFDQAGVAAAYQTLQVYGFLSLGARDVAEAQELGVVSAQRLTEALINQASVSARGSETMGLVSYALGQIRTAGKLLMQDLRQLMNAGVDVNSILNEMGYSLGDVGKEAINSDEFLLKFVETIERDLGGAAEKQASTLSGLANSIGDLGKKYLREFFGPFNEGTGQMGGILGVVQPILQKFVDTLMDDRVLKGVQTLGLLIGEGLSSGFSSLTGILTNITNTIQTPFLNIANSAFGWGANIIIQLATGIINAAGSILVNAINFVGQILANWFAPGSPPAIAPDLILWGQGAMGEWLHGFTTADFDVLKGIQQPLQAALQTMVQAGDIDAQQLADTYASITAGLAEALATGGDPSAIFDQIAEEAGAFGPELAELAKRQFDLAAGVEAVKLAEQQLAAARQAEEQAGLAVMQLTQEYNDLLRSGADDATLQAKLEEINAAEAAKEIAGQQADEAETQLDIAKANLDVLEEQVRLQQELVNQLIELARLQAAAQTPEVPEPETGGGPGAGGGLPELPGIDLPDPGEAVASFLDEIISQIQNAAAEMFAPIIAAWNNMIAAIQAAWANFWASLQASGLLEQLQSIWDNVVALTQIFLSILGEFIMGGLNMLAELWAEHKTAVFQIWASFWSLMASIAGGVLGLIVSNIDQRLEEARNFFEVRRQQISDIITLFWSNMQTAFDVGLTSLLTFTADRLTSMQALWDTNGLLILAAVDRLWDNISAVFFSVLGLLVDFVQVSLLKIQAWWTEHGANVQLVIDRFLLTIGGLFDLALLYISTAILFWTDYFADLWATHSDTIQELVQTFLDAVSAIFDTVLGAIGAAFDTWAAIFNGDWRGFLQGIFDFWKSIWDGIIAFLTASFTSMSISVGAFIDSIILFFQNLWDTLVGNSIIPDMLQDILEAFTTKFEEILNFMITWTADLYAEWNQFWADIVGKTTDRVQEVYDTIIGKIQSVIDDANGMVGEFTNIGNNLVQGIADGITSAAGAIQDAIASAIQAAIDAAKAALGIQSPSKIFEGFGANISLGLAYGITAEQRAPVAALGDTITALINPPLVSPAAGNTQYNNSLTLNMNNNVSNGIDVAALDNHILQVVKRAFGGRS